MMGKSDARQEGRTCSGEKKAGQRQPLAPNGLGDSVGLRIALPDLPASGPFWTTIPSHER